VVSGFVLTDYFGYRKHDIRIGVSSAHNHLFIFSMKLITMFETPSSTVVNYCMFLFLISVSRFIASITKLRPTKKMMTLAKDFLAIGDLMLCYGEQLVI
jgi:hypothetical protein